MRILDLCCGLGGWSKPWIEAGHDVTGVDIKDLGYPGKFIQKDIFDFNTDEKFDVILASPPCSEFSRVKMCSPKYPCYPRHGLDIVQRVFYLIQKIKPKWFCLENVPYLANYIGPPNQIIQYGKSKNRKQAYLWSNIPELGFFDQMIIYKPNWADNIKAKFESQACRAEIPFPLAKAVLTTLEEKSR